MARHKDKERDKVLGETRQSLLEAAAEDFAREGYDGANINHISARAGFAKGTIYNYFPSKRALMLALIDEVAAAHLDFIVAWVQEEQDARRRLQRFFEAGTAFVANHLAKARVMVNNIYGPHDDFKRYMYQAYQPMFQFVATDILAYGVAQGVFREMDPAATASLLMTIYLGTGSAVNEEGEPWLDPGLVADFVLNGLGEMDRRRDEKP